MRHTPIFRIGIALVMMVVAASLSDAQTPSGMRMRPERRATELVKALVGPGVHVVPGSERLVTSATQQDSAATGVFEYENGPTIGFDDGLVLSTGFVNRIPGVKDQIKQHPSLPNADSVSGDHEGPNPNPETLVLGYVGFHDYTVLEFSFVPSCTPVTFRYVFGSVEYPEYTAAYADAFGLFIKGQGVQPNSPKEFRNLALLPNGTRVSVTTVNDQSNSQFYRDANAIQGFAAGTNFHGMTTVLTAQTAVIPGQTYILRMEVADFLDAYFDSGVLLEGGSLSIAGHVSLSDTVVGCSPVSIGLDPTPGFSYRWSPDAEVDDPAASRVTLRYRNNTPDTVVRIYVLNVTTAQGCTYADSVRVTFLPVPNADAGPDGTLCIGDSVQIGTLGSTRWTYAWTPTAGLSGNDVARPQARPVTTTTYRLRVFDPVTGCSSEDDVVIRVVSPPAVVTRDSVVIMCIGESRTLSASVANADNANLRWEPSAGLDRTVGPDVRVTATAKGRTWYVVSYNDDQTGCTSRDTILVEVRAIPDATAGDDVRVCAGEAVVIGDTARCGRPPYQYQWSPSDGLSDPTIPRPSASPSQTTTYTLTVRDADGDEARDTVVVTILPRPVVSVPADISICGPDTVSLVALAAGGSAPYTYRWEPTGGVADPNSAETFAYTRMTTTYTVVVTDANGCTAQASFTVTVRPLVNVDASSDVTICANESTTLVASVTGGDSPQVTWSPSVGLSSTTGTTVTAQPLVTTTYTVTVVDRNGCTSSDVVTVNVKKVPDANAGPDVAGCPGDTRTIGAVATCGLPPFIYRWSPATGLSDANSPTPTVTIGTTTTYTLTVTDARNETSTDNVVVTAYPTPVVSAGADITICRGERRSIVAEIVQGSSTDAQFTWTGGNVQSTGQTLQVAGEAIGTTTYTVTLVDENGCSATDDIVVTVVEAPSVSIAPQDPIICIGRSVELSVPADPGAIVTWSPAEGLSSTSGASVVASPTETTVYTVRIVADNGCTAFGTVVVGVDTATSATTLDMPTYVVDPREKDLHVAVFVESAQFSERCPADQLTVSVSFDADVFYPTGVTAGTIISNVVAGGIRTVRMEIPLTSVLTSSDTMTYLRGAVLLGEPGATDLLFSDPVWRGAEVSMTLLPGRIELDPLCLDTAGRARLLSFAPSMLSVAPNPSTGAVSVTLRRTSLEDVTIDLVDGLGQRLMSFEWPAHDGRLEVTKQWHLNVTPGTHILVARSMQGASAYPITIVR